VALGTAGVIPSHDDRLRDGYSGVGVNVSVPVFNGGLFAARRTEAGLRAEAAAADAEWLEQLVARDVRVAWLDSVNAFRRLDVTARLVAQAGTALRLAQSRYDLGLSGIVELTQAQFAQTSAQIMAATAKYEYLSRRARLAYTSGGQP
jgi:outer membrane protein